MLTRKVKATLAKNLIIKQTLIEKRGLGLCYHHESSVVNILRIIFAQDFFILFWFGFR